MGLKTFLADCKGNIALSFGLLFVPLALAGGAAVDLANANFVRESLQAAADSAALAGGSNLAMNDTQLKELVVSFARANGALNAMTSVKAVKSKADRKTGTFEVAIEGKLKTGLMALAGIKELDVGVSSTVVIGSRALDVALVLDVTGSMEWKLDSGGTRMAALKVSAAKLLDTIEKEKASFAALRIGVVPFAEYVNVGKHPTVTTEGSVENWEGCVGSREAPNDVDATASGPYPVVEVDRCPSSIILPLTTNINDVRTVIQGLSGAGNTYMPAGVMWGANLLSSEAPFTEGMSNEKLEELQGSRYMIVMTDGENTISPAYPLHTNTDRGKANELTEAACTKAKAQGFKVFTISFMVQVDGAQKMLDNCASEPKMSFNADNAAQLDEAFLQIGQNLSGLRLQN